MTLSAKNRCMCSHCGEEHAHRLLEKGTNAMSQYHAESSSSHRWRTAIQDGVMILFGLVAVFWPMVTIIALVLLFASVPLH
jgi:uncharacterized membrane protein HdeD (DUF308 family)